MAEKVRTDIDDIPWLDWEYLDPDIDPPNEAGLIEVRATKGGEPVTISHPKADDEAGILYIKGCKNLNLFVRWLAKSLHDPSTSPQHPAAFIYHNTPDKEILYPLDGLQVRWATETKLRIYHEERGLS